MESVGVSKVLSYLILSLSFSLSSTFPPSLFPFFLLPPLSFKIISYIDHKSLCPWKQEEITTIL